MNPKDVLSSFVLNQHESRPFSICEKEGRGRFYIAKEELFPGQTIIEERPYAFVPSDTLLAHPAFCHHCLKKETPTNVTSFCCEACNVMFYCSETCKQEAGVFHQLECPFLGQLLLLSRNLSVSFKDLLLVFRILIHRSLEEESFHSSEMWTQFLALDTHWDDQVNDSSFISQIEVSC